MRGSSDWPRKGSVGIFTDGAGWCLIRSVYEESQAPGGNPARVVESADDVGDAGMGMWCSEPMNI